MSLAGIRHTCLGLQQHHGLRCPLTHQFHQPLSAHHSISCKATGQDAEGSPATTTDKEYKASSGTDAPPSPPPSNPAPPPKTQPGEELQDLPTGNAVIVEKTLTAAFVYALTFFLAGWNDIDPYQQLQFDPNAITQGTLTALPAAAILATFFLLPPPSHTQISSSALTSPASPALPTPTTSSSDQQEALLSTSLSSSSSSSGGISTPATLDREQLRVMRKVEESFAGVSNVVLGLPQLELPSDLTTWRRGAYWYAMYLLKPWYPPFESGTLRAVFGATALTSFAQELLLRGYLATLLAGGFTSILNSATTPDNLLFWIKVLGITRGDSARWLAAGTLAAVQVFMSLGMASTARDVVRAGLDGLRLGTPVGGAAVAPLLYAAPRLVVSTEDGRAEASAPGLPGLVSGVPNIMARRTYEDQVVYALHFMGTASIIVSTNIAYALTGNIAASYATQIVIDGVLTAVQQYASAQLPYKPTAADLAEDDSDDSDDDSDGFPAGWNATRKQFLASTLKPKDDSKPSPYNAACGGCACAAPA